MRQIPLTKGKYAKVSDKDYHYLSQWTWQAFRSKRNWYAKTRTSRTTPGGRRTLLMHQLIAERKRISGRADHRNRNGLDNRRCNLRPASIVENGGNCRRSPHNTSGFRGVYWHKGANKWAAQIGSGKSHEYLGLFTKKRDAAIAYNRAARRRFGRLARLNKVKK